MAFFQRDTMIGWILDRMLMLTLVLTIGAGCAPLRSDTPVTSDVMVQEESADRINQLRDVAVSTSDNQIFIHIETETKPAYTAIKQDFPLGVAIYLPGTRLGPEFKSSAEAEYPVQVIRTGYADQENETAKIEILLYEDLPYVVEAKDNALQVVLNKTRPEIETRQLPDGFASTAPATSSMDTESSVASDTRKPATAAKMTHIEFNTTGAGHSDIRVTTTDPVRYDTFWQTDTRLELILYDTQIPAVHQQLLHARSSNAAVDRILPQPDPADSRNTKVEIMIREKVPFRIVQDHNRISLQFEPADLNLPQFEKENTPDSGFPALSGMENGTTPSAPEASLETITAGQSPDDSLDFAPVPGPRPKYVGEKIKLDFYDTDIKNVFRILKSVSGLNFAIDQDVQGKVTMSLEKPVPWDQVLDLVLKMNGLGKKMEGDVVRIATIQTLKQEEQDEQEAFAAKKKALEQKKSLEPLITEYIPISYSNAKTEIEPHITTLLTPERGNISVDQRSNMIIVTDTRETVDQIQEMIYRLDTVTPQIMIEAKIVEVTKEFSRDIGIGWNLTTDPAISSGFVNDMNVSVNSPTGDGGMSGDFSFFRLFGSSRLALNAKLAASEARGEVRIVSSPRILTLDNKEAKIKQGLEYPYQVVEDSEVSTEFKEINLELVVTPHVTPDERISMQVSLMKNDIAGETSSGEAYLSTNEAKTELLVNDNDTVVIGGVVKTTKTDNDDGLPFLSGIPIIGKILFGTNSKEDNRNELLIFLTPSIVQLEQKRNPARRSD